MCAFTRKAPTTPGPMTEQRTRSWLGPSVLPLHRNGLALVGSLGATSALGLVYWALAARNYHPTVVGINSALISAMMLLGNLSQLGLANFLNRFLPRAGGASRRYIFSAYALSAFAGLIAASIFVLGIEVWAPTLRFLLSDRLMAIWFISATVLWCVFALQDGALVGLRHAHWVPLENILFAITKLALLLALAEAFSAYGIFASWTFPLLFLILVINLLLTRRVLPQHMAQQASPDEKFGRAEIVQFLAGDYFSTLIWLLTLNLMPIIVLERAGTSANAYFYLPWTISYSLYLVSRSVGISLTVEAARDPARLADYSFRSLVLSAILLIPAVTLVILAAPLILRLFGEEYALSGVRLLRLLALSALPNIITSIYISIARVERRIIDILLTFGALSVIVLGLSIYLLDRLGLSGVGWAWLIGQSLLAIYLLLTRFRSLVDDKLLAPLLPHFSRWRRHNRRATSLIKPRRMVDEELPLFLSRLPEPGLGIPGSSWQVLNTFESPGSAVVIVVGQSGSSDQLVIHLSHNPETSRRMELRQSNIARLQKIAKLGEWRQVLPAFLGGGLLGNDPYWVARSIPGTPASELLLAGAPPARVLEQCAAMISVLHQETSRVMPVNDLHLQNWLGNPMQDIRGISSDRRQRLSLATLDRIVAAAADNLRKLQVPIGWIHGDFWPENILVGSDGKVSGIIDWDQADEQGLPYLDLVNLFLSTRRHFDRRELGAIIVDLLASGDWDPSERQIWQEARTRLGGDAPGLPEMMVIFWIQHMRDHLQKSTSSSSRRIWLSRNHSRVLPVLQRYFLQDEIGREMQPGGEPA